MSSTSLLAFRARLVAVLLAGAAPMAAVQAQAQAPQPQPQPAPSAKPADTKPDRETRRQNQKIERIHIDDGGATVDELRVGGQTQNITVTPKSNMPAYQVQPNDERARNQTQPDTPVRENGQRVWWDVFKF
jgi:hypothetical protein